VPDGPDPRPTDGDLAAVAAELLGWRGGVTLLERVVVRRRPGRCVERVCLSPRAGRGRALRVAVKWRHDRPDDREALVYRGLAPAVRRLLGAPRCLGSARVGPTHLLLLAWVDGRPADWGSTGDLLRALGHLGRVHGTTARLWRRAPHRLACPELLAALRPGPSAGAPAAGEPEVLDPGDLHADNVLFRPDGGVCLLDFEALAVRPRLAAVAAFLRDAGPPPALCAWALSTYWTAAGWQDDLASFRCALGLPPGGPCP
jgi:hypothetical protein